MLLLVNSTVFWFLYSNIICFEFAILLNLRQCKKYFPQSRNDHEYVRISYMYFIFSLFQLPSGTPTRYRSLDTLTTGRETADQNLPAPGPLQKHHTNDKSSMDVNDQDNKKVS